MRTILDRANARISGKFGKQPLVEAAVRETIADTYSILGLDAESTEQLESAIKLKRHALGPNDPGVLKSSSELADAYVWERGHVQEAKELLQKTLDSERHVLGESHPDTLETSNSLAMVEDLQGNFAGAEAIAARSLVACQRVLGPEDKMTLDSTLTLVSVLIDQDKYSEADKLLAKVLSCRACASDTKVEAEWSQAVLYTSVGRCSESETFFLNTLDTLRRAEGQQTRLALKCENRLAEAYMACGEYARAQRLFKEMLTAEKGVFGESHIETLRTLANLGFLYLSKRKYTRAEPLLTKVVYLGRSQRKENLLVLQATYDLASLHLYCRRFAEAEELARSGLHVWEKTLPDSWHRYSCQNLVGRILAARGKYAEAEPLLLSGYEGMKRREANVPAVRRFQLKQGGEWLAELYERWGKREKSAQWRLKLSLVSGMGALNKRDKSVPLSRLFLLQPMGAA